MVYEIEISATHQDLTMGMGSSMFFVEVSSVLCRGTSASKMRWTTAHAQQKESWAKLGIGPTLEVERDVNRDLAYISLNEKAKRAIHNVTDTAEQPQQMC